MDNKKLNRLHDRKEELEEINDEINESEGWTPL